MPAGYSKRSTVEKLGFKRGQRVVFVGMPKDVERELGALPEGCERVAGLRGTLDGVHVFVTTQKELRAQLARAKSVLAPAGMIWVSWPKRSSGVATDVTEDVIRAAALASGLVDVKVCAVTRIWSGLKLVIPVAQRPKAASKRR